MLPLVVSVGLGETVLFACRRGGGCRAVALTAAPPRRRLRPVRPVVFLPCRRCPAVGARLLGSPGHRARVFAVGAASAGTRAGAWLSPWFLPRRSFRGAVSFSLAENAQQEKSRAGICITSVASAFLT